MSSNLIDKGAETAAHSTNAELAAGFARPPRHKSAGHFDWTDGDVGPWRRTVGDDEPGSVRPNGSL